MFRIIRRGVFIIAVGLLVVCVPAANTQPPPAMDPAEGIVPAQFLQPPAPIDGRTFNPSPSGTIRAAIPAMPPTPAVHLMLLVPQDIAPGQSVPYTIRVVNSSAGRADKVVVRFLIPTGVEPKPTTAEPLPSIDAARPTELFWNLGTMEPNATKNLELSFKLNANATDLSAKAYVSFQHGQQVKTTISAPKLKVKTEIGNQPMTDAPIPVRVTIRNDGRVPISGAKLTETVPEGFAFHKDTLGEKGAKPEQRIWDVGTVRPGEVRTYEYRLMAKTGRVLQVLTAVDANGTAQASDSAEAKVLETGLQIDFSGDGKTTGDAAASYEVVVKNTGTVPLTNLRVSGTIPSECLPRRITNGGQVYRDQVIWTIPKLAPGDRESFRWSLQTNSAGRRSIRATAVAGRGLEDTKTVETVFQGTPVLNWETSFDRATVGMERQGLMTVKVANSGSESASNVRLVVDLPRGMISLIEASPAYKRTGDQVVFEPLLITAGRAQLFSITFKGEQLGKANFAAKLNADSLGAKPLRAEKYVEIVR